MLKARIAMIAFAVIVLAIGAFCIAPTRAAIEALSCGKSTSCLEWDNTGTGNAIKGVSIGGSALHGQTKYNSAGRTSGKSGVLGEDLSPSGTLNAGVSGVSTNGAGVIGTSTSFNAVEGLSSLSTGVYGQTASGSGLGVAGRNTASWNGNGAGVYADGGPANDGVRAFSNARNKSAVYAFSQIGTALTLNNGQGDGAPELSVQDVNNQYNLAIRVDGQNSAAFDVGNDGTTFIGGRLTVQALGPSTGMSLVYVSDNSGSTLMYVDDGGNLQVSGLLFSGGGCNTGCSVGPKRTHSVGAYAAVETEPTIDDNGEARLVNGDADVALDPKFANVIDPNSQYLVTLTPEGDSRGLYVARRTATGFSVRESQGGHSTIGFAYRIVAKRFGVHAPRLPMTAVRAAGLPPRRMR